MDKFKLDITGKRGEFLTLIVDEKVEMQELLEMFVNSGKKVSVHRIKLDRPTHRKIDNVKFNKEEI